MKSFAQFLRDKHSEYLYNNQNELYNEIKDKLNEIIKKKCSEYLDKNLSAITKEYVDETLKVLDDLDVNVIMADTFVELVNQSHQCFYLTKHFSTWTEK